MNAGYYWAYTLMNDGSRLESSPSVVYVSTRGDVQLMGYDMDMPLSGFEILGPVTPYSE